MQFWQFANNHPDVLMACLAILVFGIVGLAKVLRNY